MHFLSRLLFLIYTFIAFGNDYLSCTIEIYMKQFMLYWELMAHKLRNTDHLLQITHDHFCMAKVLGLRH